MEDEKCKENMKRESKCIRNVEPMFQEVIVQHHVSPFVQRSMTLTLNCKIINIPSKYNMRRKT